MDLVCYYVIIALLHVLFKYIILYLCYLCTLFNTPCLYLTNKFVHFLTHYTHQLQIYTEKYVNIYSTTVTCKKCVKKWTSKQHTFQSVNYSGYSSCDERAYYPCFVVIVHEHDTHTVDSLVWGLLRLAPMMIMLWLVS